MPEQEEVRRVYENVSIEGLNAALDENPDIEQKLLLAQFYILSYGAKGQPSCSLAQLINAAKEKLLQASVDAKYAFYNEHGYAPAATSFKGVDPGRAESSEGPVFLKDPVTYMANMAKVMAISPVPEGAPDEFVLLKNNCAKLVDQIYNPNTIQEYQSMQKNNRVQGLISGVAKLQPGRDNASVAEILDRHKGGWWERWRKKTSPEFIRFRDTKAYLQHKIPGYDPDQLPTQDQIDALSGTGKGRAQLCLDVLKVLREQRNLANSDEIYHENGIEHNLIDLTPAELEEQYMKEMAEEAEENKEFENEVENDLEENEPEPVEEDKEKDNEPVVEKEDENVLE